MELYRRHQKEENLQMLDLNQRLESYLGRVRLLEVENELLRREIQGIKGCGQGERIGLQDKLSLARQEVEEVWREKDQVELELRCLAEELHDLGLQRQQVAGAHGEVNKKLAESKKQMEEEGRAQIWLRRKVSQLEEEIQFQVQTHQKDIANLQDTLIHVTPALPIPPNQMGTQLPNLRELGQEYSQMAVRAWQETTMRYQGQLDHLEESLSQAKSRLAQVGQKKTESLLKIQGLENELASAQDRRTYLERHLSHQRESQRQEIQDLQAHVEVLEMEKAALGDQLDCLLTECRGLLQLKMTLGIEVATYRALLDSEGLTGNFSLTKQLRSTYITDGVHNLQGAKPGFQTQLDTSHRISGTSILQGRSRQSNTTMSSSSPIWTLNQTPQKSRKTEEEQFNFSLEFKHQPRWSTPYTKVPKDGIAVDHFRPQDVHEKVNHAEPLSPPTEKAGADLVARHGPPDFEARSMWDMEKEEKDKNIVRTWLAKEEPLMESSVSHQIASCFYAPPLLNVDAESICSATVSYEGAKPISTVSDAHSGLKTHDDVVLETPSETKERLQDLPSSPVNAWEEGALKIIRKDAEDVEEQGLESEMAFETKTSSNMFEHGVRKTGCIDSKEENISYECSPPSQCAEEAFHHVRKLEEDVINLSKKDDENYIQYEKQVEDDLQIGNGNEDKLKILEGFNDLKNMKDLGNSLEEVFHHVERAEEGDISLSNGEKIKNISNQGEDQDQLSTYGIETDKWDGVGCFIEKDDIEETIKVCKEGHFLKEEDMLNQRETKANHSEQIIPLDGENLNENEEEQISSVGEKLDISEQDKIPSGGVKLDIFVQKKIPSFVENLDNSEQDQIPSVGEKEDISEQEQIPSFAEQLDESEQETFVSGEENVDISKQEQIHSIGEKIELSEQEKIHSNGEKMYTSEQEKIVSGGENLDISVQELIPSFGENIDLSEEEQIQSIQEKLDKLEEEQIPSVAEKLDTSKQEKIVSDGENLDISEQTQIPSVEEELDIIEKEQIPSFGENLDLSEQEKIHSNGEKLDTSQQKKIVSGGENLDISVQEQIPSFGDNIDLSEQEQIHSIQEKFYILEEEQIPSVAEKLDTSEQEKIVSDGENLDISEQTQIPSVEEKLDIIEKEQIPSIGENLDLSEQEKIHSNGEKLDTSEQEKIVSGGENLDISVQEQIPSFGENIDLSEQEQIHSIGEKVDISEQVQIPSVAVQLDTSEQEKIVSSGENLDISEQEQILSGEENLDKSEHEKIPSIRENVDLSEQEKIHPGGEKLYLSEQEKILSGGEKRDISLQEQIPSFVDNLDLSEQEQIPSIQEKIYISEEEQIPSVSEKLDTSEQEKTVSDGENLDISEQMQIPSGEENLDKSEQKKIPSVEEQLDISLQEQIPSFVENIDLSEQEQIQSIGKKLDIFEQVQIPSVAVQLGASEQKKIVSGRENLDISEQEQIHSIREKLDLSEQDKILSGGEKLDISVEEHIHSFGENINLSEQEQIHSTGEKLDISEQKQILSVAEKLDTAEEEKIVSSGEILDISEQEKISSDGEKLDISEHKCIPSSGQTLNLPINDELYDIDENDSPTTSISWKAELVGGSYAQENTLADTRPLIRYKSDETDANTQASHMGETDSSDGEEHKDVRQTGTCTWGERKSKSFGTMEDLNEVSEGNAMDQEGNKDWDASESKENGKQGSNDKHDADLWNQKAEEELLFEESTTPGEYSEEYSEKIDRLVEQELENLSISSYSEQFIGPMSESESVLSLQAKDILCIEDEHGCVSTSGVKLNLPESDKMSIGEEVLNKSHEEHFLSSEENLNQSEPDKMPLREETLNQSQQEHILLSEEELNQSQQEDMSSEAMSSVHSTILMTSEQTYFRENSVKMSQAEYLAKENVFSKGLQATTETDKGESIDQNISVHNDNSIHSQINSRPEIQTNINNSDIDESNSSDDDSPNGSQYLKHVTRANVTTDQEDLDAAVSQKRHSYVDCITLVEHSPGEATTNYQTNSKCLQGDNLDDLGHPNKYPESGDTFTSHIKDLERSPKTDSRDQNLQMFFSSGVDNDFWGSDLEKGATYQPLEPYDLVTKQSNQSLVWGDLENHQMSSWNTNVDSDTTKGSALKEAEKRSSPQMTHLICTNTDLVEGVNVASEDEGDSWSSRDE